MTRRRPGRPTVAQLLILVDRAHRGLTPEEAAVLRAGLLALDAARRSAGGSQTAVQAARAETARAVGERDAAVRLLASVYGYGEARALADVQAEAGRPVVRRDAA